MATNKERLGQIGTKTLANGILITIDVWKELAFYDNSKCIKYIKFQATDQKLRAWENMPDFKKRGNIPTILK